MFSKFYMNSYLAVHGCRWGECMHCTLRLSLCFLLFTSGPSFFMLNVVAAYGKLELNIEPQWFGQQPL